MEIKGGEMNFSKQKYKAFVGYKWTAGIIYGKTLDEVNKKIDAIKERYSNVKVKIYTRDDQAETPAFAQWRLIETREEEQ